MPEKKKLRKASLKKGALGKRVFKSVPKMRGIWHVWPYVEFPIDAIRSSFSNHSNFTSPWFGSANVVANMVKLNMELDVIGMSGGMIDDHLREMIEDEPVEELGALFT